MLNPSLPQLAQALRAGSVCAEALLERAIDQYSQHPHALDAYQSWTPETALLQARAADAAFAAGSDLGPLQGLPVSIKDLYGVRGYPTYAGTPKRLPAEWEQEGPLVASIRQQLAVISGKTHTVELAFGGLGTNPHWVTPRNPWDSDQHRVPGGSSAGAGVSLATGSALLALGTDTAGSVRIPASMTGQVGLKTSFGRWSTQGIVPLSPSLDTAGLLARSVEDATFAFQALDPQARSRLQRTASPVSPDLTGIRIGISEDVFWDDCSPGIVEGVRQALAELARAGARQCPLALPEVGQVYPLFRKGGLAATELYVFLQAELPDWLPLLDPSIAQRMSEAATLPACEYLERVRVFHRLSRQVDAHLQQVDVLVSPTVAITPPELARLQDPAVYRTANLLALRNTAVVNYLNLCAITLPVALDSAGMPVGMQLIARHGQDERLLTIAGAFERVLGQGSERLGQPPQVPFQCANHV